MTYSGRREQLYTKSKLIFAEPVAWLLATTYEPRLDGVPSHPDFDQLVEDQQKFIRTEIEKLSGSQGGRVEQLLTDVAKSLINHAETNDLFQQTQLLHAALERCQRTERQTPQRTPVSSPTTEPKRVAGRTGKPIGLWR